MAPEPAAKKKKAGGRHLDLSPLYIVVPLLGPQGKNMSRLQGLSYHTGDSKGLLHAVLWEVILDLLDLVNLQRTCLKRRQPGLSPKQPQLGSHLNGYHGQISRELGD